MTCRRGGQEGWRGSGCRLCTQQRSRASEAWQSRLAVTTEAVLMAAGRGLCVRAGPLAGSGSHRLGGQLRLLGDIFLSRSVSASHGLYNSLTVSTGTLTTSTGTFNAVDYKLSIFSVISFLMISPNLYDISLFFFLIPSSF